MKYRVEKSGHIYVEAKSEQEAEEIANESPVEKWKWEDCEAEEW